ncbi:MAG: hypothetical protein ACYDEX_20950 [Mobilitalea sp.]
MKYEVWFKLVNEEKENLVDFQKKEYKNVIEDAIKRFNIAGNIARNKKNIYAKEIQKNIIKIFFESDIELEKPTKSFRFFSKDLIDNSDAFSDLIIGGRLLKGVYSGEAIDSSDELEGSLMSDEQMLTILIHWCMSKEIQSIDDKKSKLSTIEKIKTLITECLIISK